MSSTDNVGFRIGDIIAKENFEEIGDTFVGCIVEDMHPRLLKDLDVKYKPRWGVRFKDIYRDRIYYFTDEEITLVEQGDCQIPSPYGESDVMGDQVVRILEKILSSDDIEKNLAGYLKHMNEQKASGYGYYLGPLVTQND